ncbi:hypothetical protein AB0I75_35640 [Streptomyces sp. NPDC050273]|uniref:hypothetical protein n=1 Tax=Streptomyces sp. NPDC050273 TaxID=3154933 RepID=UPI00342DFF75
MNKHLSLREAVLSWLEYAGSLSPTPQSIVVLMLQPHWDDVVKAVAAAAPREEHPDLYSKVDGDLNPVILLKESGLGEAARLISYGEPIVAAEVADNFVTFCTARAPVHERWLLLNGTFPQGTRIPLGRHTLQTFTEDELRQTVPMPALNVLQSRNRDLGLITGAPFLHVPDPGRTVTRRPTWFDFTGPRAETQHWQALLPLMLWDSELLRVDSVFSVARGRRFDLDSRDVPTTIQVHEGRYGREEEVEVRDTGDFRVSASDLAALTDFCTAISAKIDAIMSGATHKLRILNRRARRLERAARHLLAAYQRTYNDNGVWEVEADEIHLDYVIALEALLISPKDKEHKNIADNIRSRAATLFSTPHHQEEARAIVERAYRARSTYVHGDVIKDQTHKEKLKELRTLRLLTLQVILRWLVLTPSDTDDLAPLLDAGAHGTGRECHIDQPLRAFFTTTPPRSRPADIPAT